MMRFSSKKEHLEKVSALLRSIEGIEFYDFSRGSTLGTSDCEFLDGTHPGDVVYYRMLESILSRNPASSLRPYVSLSLVREQIQRFEERTIADDNFEEGDFLELGCAKELPRGYSSVGLKIKP